jgi:hypothetical protein
VRRRNRDSKEVKGVGAVQGRRRNRDSKEIRGAGAVQGPGNREQGTAQGHWDNPCDLMNRTLGQVSQEDKEQGHPSKQKKQGPHRGGEKIVAS